MVPRRTDLAYYNKGGDSQIMTSELLAVALGLATLGDKLRSRSRCKERKVIQPDQNALVHAIWKQALELDTDVWVE